MMPNAAGTPKPIENEHTSALTPVSKTGDRAGSLDFHQNSWNAAWILPM